MTPSGSTDDQAAADYRDPSVWRNGLAAARAALRAAEESPRQAEPGRPPHSPRSCPPEDETVRSSEGPVARARRIAAWVNGVGDPDQLEGRQ